MKSKEGKSGRNTRQETQVAKKKKKQYFFKKSATLKFFFEGQNKTSTISPPLRGGPPSRSSMLFCPSKKNFSSLFLKKYCFFFMLATCVSCLPVVENTTHKGHVGGHVHMQSRGRDLLLSAVNHPIHGVAIQVYERRREQLEEGHATSRMQPTIHDDVDVCMRWASWVAADHGELHPIYL